MLKVITIYSLFLYNTNYGVKWNCKLCSAFMNIKHDGAPDWKYLFGHQLESYFDNFCNPSESFY